MRNTLLAALCTAALVLSGCTESSETYPLSVDDAWSKVTNAGMGAIEFGVPSGLLGADVSAAFQVIPTDRTAYWKFSRNGKELGRVNVAVEGDAQSTTVSYSYAKGDLAAEDEKPEQMIRQYAQPLLLEAVDSRLEGRPRDEQMKNLADAHTAMAMSGNFMKDASAAMDEAVRESDARAASSEGESAARAAQYTSTKPSTDLSKY